MLDFLKKFLKKEEIREERLSLTEVRGWLEKHAPNFEEEKKELKNLKEELEANLKKLEQVNTNEIKVEEKLKLMVQSNIPAYILQTNLLLKKIEVEQLKDYYSFHHFCKEFDASLVTFTKKTIRNFYIIQNLIGEELSRVAKNIRDITATVERIKKKMEKEKIGLHQETAESLEKINFLINSKGEKERKIGECEKEISLLKQNKEDLIISLQTKEEDVEFLELKKLREDLELIEKEQLAIKSELISLFSPLGKGFKKLGKIDALKFVDFYLESPLDALIKDENMEILTILRSLKESINKLNLKEDKKTKILEGINALSAKNLDSYKKKFLGLEKQKLETEKSLKQNKAEEEKKETEREIKNIEQTILLNEEEREKLNASMNLNKELEILEKKLTILAGHEVKIHADLG